MINEHLVGQGNSVLSKVTVDQAPPPKCCSQGCRGRVHGLPGQSYYAAGGSIFQQGRLDFQHLILCCPSCPAAQLCLKQCSGANLIPQPTFEQLSPSTDGGLVRLHCSCRALLAGQGHTGPDPGAKGCPSLHWGSRTVWTDAQATAAGGAPRPREHAQRALCF